MQAVIPNRAQLVLELARSTSSVPRGWQRERTGRDPGGSPAGGLEAEATATREARMSAKITSDHLGRAAVVYVRQSTMAQVIGNLESQRRQYDLAGAARSDWLRIGDGHRRGPRPLRIGQHGAARVRAARGDGLCSGNVGAVYCIEASRLARNGRDWHHLIDLCALTGDAGHRSGWRLRSAARERSPAARAEGDDVGIRAEPDAPARHCRPRFQGAARRVPLHAAARLLLERGGQDRDRS